MLTSSQDASMFIEGWMASVLREQFGFTSLLPVQACTIPYFYRTLRSGLPTDMCLSAPTGSGKTLCYLIPIIQYLAEHTCLNSSGAETKLRAIILVPSKALGRQVTSIARKLSFMTSLQIGSVCGDNPKEESSVLVRRGGGGTSTSNYSSFGEDDDGDLAGQNEFFYYYSNVDVLVATPQRLLKHLGTTPGFTLEALQVLIMDEADDLLSGTFTNFSSRVIEHYEKDVAMAAAASRLPQSPEEGEERGQGNSSYPTASSSSFSCCLKKVLCSATLTSHIAKISEIRLTNPKYFSLDSKGQSREDQEDGVGKTFEGEQASIMNVSFSLNPNLYEHYLIVPDESQRHAIFLNVIQHIRAHNAELNIEKKSIIVFCQSSETTRVVSAFLTACRIPTLEFSAAVSEAERRRALLDAYRGTSVGKVIVATDSLMRGIDVPGVGAVVMYSAPTTLRQYVHRVGRTARANFIGHSYVFLSKIGPSQTTVDGEVAVFKSFEKQLKRERMPQREMDLQKFRNLGGGTADDDDDDDEVKENKKKGGQENSTSSKKLGGTSTEEFLAYANSCLNQAQQSLIKVFQSGGGTKQKGRIHSTSSTTPLHHPELSSSRKRKRVSIEE